MVDKIVKEKDEASDLKAGESIWEVFSTIFYALLIALVIRVFLYQPFNIPSGSMFPTLLVGDYVFVSKSAYGYSKYSVPFSPDIGSGRVWEGSPKRGDVAVFRKPTDTSIDYIKRIIGLPGDTIQVRDGILYLNGDAVKREPAGTFDISQGNGQPYMAPMFRETLPNGKSYLTLDYRNQSLDNTQVYNVPPGHYFAMGDNRDNSQDSRVLSAVGYIPAENLVGRAEVIFFSLGGNARFWEIWKWPTSLRFNRFFDGLG